MKRIQKFALGAVSACVMAMSPIAANADTIQLGFILDESGSIGAANWGVITSGLASALDLIPVGGADTYEVSIVSFSSGATTRASNVVIDSVMARTALSTAVAAYSFGSGLTNYTAAFDAMTSVLGNTIAGADTSYVNFATDGAPNTGGSGVASAAALIASGVDNLSVEGIGVSAALAANLQANFCHPQPCDTTQPFNFPTEGFYIGVADANAYAGAIGNKIRTVTGQPLPEPGTIALVGVALAGLGLTRRKTAQAA